MNAQYLKHLISSSLPPFINNRLHQLRDISQLKAIQRVECQAAPLRLGRDIRIAEILTSCEYERHWVDSEKSLNSLALRDGTGGVNPGDRKALFFLICALKPRAALEIGTHIGASTVHIASGLYRSQILQGGNASLTTVDIEDVNCPVRQPWKRYGAEKSPKEMLKAIDCEPCVEFVTDTSINYLINCKHKFDFIFLDGDHSARTVYQEIPLALELLNRNGIILLHDYFPGLKPLWSNGSVISGPYLAIERLQREGANIAVLPLGQLPWPSKLGLKATSLAVLAKS